MAAIEASNGRTQALNVTSNGAPTVTTLLGRTAMRIPTAGRIRAGIKVLTRRAAEIAEARRIYDAGVAAGQSFDAIEREIAVQCPGLKNPLTPKNVPYFTVRGEDFPNPEVARQIMERFAEDRGDGVLRLYRFPVVFPADAWQNVMPHELVTWTSRERRYWSEYSADGQTRFCKTHEAVPVDSNGRRTVRLFGGRKAVLRQENQGLCEPESCPEYQSKKCNLSGRLIFFIPGIKSISAFELPTNSFYAMQAAIEKFQTIGFMRGGRISGFLDGNGATFFITKRLVEVSRIDDEGQPSRVAHWLIELEAPVDVTALLRSDDGLEAAGALEERAGEAATLLGRRRHVGRAPQVDENGVIEVVSASQDGATDGANDDPPPAEDAVDTDSRRQAPSVGRQPPPRNSADPDGPDRRGSRGARRARRARRAF